MEFTAFAVKEVVFFPLREELNLPSLRATISGTRFGGVCAALQVTHGLEFCFFLPSIVERSP
jgi:hypothetical protein